MTDLVKNLRTWANPSLPVPIDPITTQALVNIIGEAADHIEQLQARLEELEKGTHRISPFVVKTIIGGGDYTGASAQDPKAVRTVDWERVYQAMLTSGQE